MYKERNDACLKYSKSIVEYSIGSRLTKHCAPWGDNTLLCNNYFVLAKFVYRSNGRISSVILEAEETGDQYLLGPAFFPGWCDEKAMYAYFKRS
jgi:hypothetical protein